jgi:nicrotizing toxin Mtb-like protein
VAWPSSVLTPCGVIDRFGKADGRFLSPIGTSYEQCGLPPQNPDDGYHQYQVIKDIRVWAGKISPAMGQPGGGIQYLSPGTVADLILAGHLKEI